MAPRVLGISGSLRAGSYNTLLLRSAAELLAPHRRLELWGALKDIPPFDEDDETGSPHIAVARLRRAVAGADAILIATPEYNSSLPGQLKNAFDWLSRPYASNPLRAKPVAVIGASTGMFGAVWAQAEARRVLQAMGARVLDRELPVGSAHQRFDADGRLVDGDVGAGLRELLDELLDDRREAASHARG